MLMAFIHMSKMRFMFSVTSVEIVWMYSVLYLLFCKVKLFQLTFFENTENKKNYQK